MASAEKGSVSQTGDEIIVIDSSEESIDEDEDGSYDAVDVIDEVGDDEQDVDNFKFTAARPVGAGLMDSFQTFVHRGLRVLMQSPRCPIDLPELAYVQPDIDASTLPLLGIGDVFEVENEDRDFAPGYLCSLCGRLLKYNTVVSHLADTYHRVKYMAKYDPARFASLTIAQKGDHRLLLEYAKQISSIETNVRVNIRCGMKLGKSVLGLRRREVFAKSPRVTIYPAVNGVFIEPKLKTIQQRTQPLIGLSSIYEVQHENARFAPGYYCGVCDQLFDITRICLHLTSTEHRMSYMTVNYPRHIKELATAHKNDPNMVKQYAQAIMVKEGPGQIVERLQLKLTEAEMSIPANYSFNQRSQPVATTNSLIPKWKNTVKRHVDPNSVLLQNDPALNRLCAGLLKHSKVLFTEFEDPYIESDLSGCMQPLVGIQHVLQVDCESDDYEPAYLCATCMQLHRCNTIVRHLCGTLHRLKYMEKYHPSVYTSIQDQENHSTVRFAALRCFKRENSPRLKYRVETKLPSAVLGIPKLNITELLQADRILLTEKSYLQDGLSEDTRELIGLRMIYEVASADSRFAPGYLCSLCRQFHRCNTITNHVCSTEHRLKYMKSDYPHYYNRINRMRDHELEEEVRHYARRIIDKEGTSEIKYGLSVKLDQTRLYIHTRVAANGGYLAFQSKFGGATTTTTRPTSPSFGRPPPEVETMDERPHKSNHEYHQLGDQYEDRWLELRDKIEKSAFRRNHIEQQQQQRQGSSFDHSQQRSPSSHSTRLSEHEQSKRHYDDHYDDDHRFNQKRYRTNEHRSAGTSREPDARPRYGPSINRNDYSPRNDDEHSRERSVHLTGSRRDPGSTSFATRQNIDTKNSKSSMPLSRSNASTQGGSSTGPSNSSVVAELSKLINNPTGSSGELSDVGKLFEMMSSTRNASYRQPPSNPVLPHGGSSVEDSLISILTAEKDRLQKQEQETKRWLNLLGAANNVDSQPRPGSSTTSSGLWGNNNYVSPLRTQESSLDSTFNALRAAGLLQSHQQQRSMPVPPPAMPYSFRFNSQPIPGSLPRESVPNMNSMSAMQSRSVGPQKSISDTLREIMVQKKKDDLMASLLHANERFNTHNPNW